MKAVIQRVLESSVTIDKQIVAFKGPEYDMLNSNQKEFISSNIFKISNNYNRMAIQLSDLLVNNLNPIITSIVMPGTVQLTPAGSLIILMKDCQTTGGYPRILQIEEKSINCETININDLKDITEKVYALYPTVGENLDFIQNNQLKNIKFLYRKLDQFSWQYCNKGFFNFKNYIPKIIAKFN